MDKRYPWEQGLAVLPEHLRTGLRTLGPDRLSRLEEARLRRGFPMTALLPEGEIDTDTPPIGEEDLRQVLENATQSSAHTALDRVRQGFVTLRGGHRVGLCGSVVRRDGQIVTLRELSSLSIRVARPVTGQARTRGLSDGDGVPPLRVGVADERGEIAALWRGEPQLYVGRRTDVLDGCSKAEGLSILIRGMNPQAVAVDEITDPADVRAVTEAAGCGAALLATAHGRGPEDLRRRPVYRALLSAGVFRRLVVLDRRDGQRTARVEALP